MTIGKKKMSWMMLVKMELPVLPLVVKGFLAVLHPPDRILISRPRRAKVILRSIRLFDHFQKFCPSSVIKEDVCIHVVFWIFEFMNKSPNPHPTMLVVVVCTMLQLTSHIFAQSHVPGSILL